MPNICAGRQPVELPSHPAVVGGAILTAALLTWGAYPLRGSPALIWVALVPLVLLCRRLPPQQAFLCGLTYGVLAVQLICHWAYVVPGFRWFHGLTLALYLGLYPGAWCLCCSLFGRRQHSFLLPGAALWVLLDYAKAHAGFLAFPWASLAHSQFELTLLLQISAVTGEYGVTFLIVLVNVALAEWWVSRRTMAPLCVIALVGAVWLQGGLVLHAATGNPQQNLAIAVVQPSIARAERQSASGREASFFRLAGLTEAAAALRPDLIVLPETAIRLDRHGADHLTRMVTLAGDIGIPIIFGASESEKFSTTAPDSQPAGFTSEFRVRWHNSAFLSLPGGDAPVAPYRKRRLVPFGEYNPLPGWLKPPPWLIPATGTIEHGNAARRFVMESGISVAPVICWEILFPGLLRDSVGDTRPDLIAHLTNANWFGRSAAAVQQNSAAVFRAIEQRIPVVIAANTGPSVLFDAFGRRSAAHDEMFQAATFIGHTTPGRAYAATFYQKNGNLFVLFCLFLFGSIACPFLAPGPIKDKFLISSRTLPLKQENVS